MNSLALITIYASSSGDDPSVYLLAAGPLAGITFFMFVFRRYRNFDKRHKYEHSPSVRSSVTKKEDRYLGTITKSTESKIRSGNYEHPTWRIGQEPPLEVSSGAAFLKFFKGN